MGRPVWKRKSLPFLCAALSASSPALTAGSRITSEGLTPENISGSWKRRLERERARCVCVSDNRYIHLSMTERASLAFTRKPSTIGTNTSEVSVTTIIPG